VPGFDIEWVTVFDPGNAADASGFGATSEVYQIGRFEVTNRQYAVFLNAVAALDLNGLYNPNMGSPLGGSYGGISRIGTSGSLSYELIPGRENLPVNWVSFYDALRFANWLHNGQPSGAQDDTTTEDGAYTITPGGIAGNSITRAPDARVFLTSEDEWYKAAYYNPISMSYFSSPTQGTQTTCSVPGATPETANCSGVLGDLSLIGGYTGSASPNASFDQGGNVSEWNESIIAGANRSVRGGSAFGTSSTLLASTRLDFPPTSEFSVLGFRVARPPPERVPSLSPLGLLLLCCLMGLTGYTPHTRWACRA
jgi:formylglycine-generating enzyme required for sulfatase activity